MSDRRLEVCAICRMRVYACKRYNPSMQHVTSMEQARFVLDAVRSLDLGALVQRMGDEPPYPYHPAMLVALLFLGFANGKFAGCELERATYDDPVYRYVASDAHPSCALIVAFRERYLPQLLDAFLQLVNREARAPRSQLRHEVAAWFLSAERAGCGAGCRSGSVAAASAR